MTATHRFMLTAVAVVASMALSQPAFAQRGGGGGGRGGGGAPSVAISRSRLSILEEDFKLTKDQKKAIKTLLDDAGKSAVPVREALAKTRAALSAAIQGNKGQTEIDTAVKAYAEQATAMTAIEIKALADVMKALDATQRANNAAISSAFFMMRGAFIEKNWDDVPTGKLY